MAEVIPLDMVKTQNIGQSAAKFLHIFNKMHGKGSETRCLWVGGIDYSNDGLRYSPSLLETGDLMEVSIN